MRRTFTQGKLGKLDANSVELATTVSRTILGYMNEMARYCHSAITAQGGFERIDFDSLNRQLRRELHLSRQAPGFFVPIELAAKR
jgi:hypothetical protein